MTHKQPSLAEPLSHLARIPIRDSGEPLVDFLVRCPLLLLARPRYDYERVTLLRVGVVDRLCQAVSRLPSGFRFSIIEGWRHPQHQRLQYNQTEARLRREHPEWPESTLRRTLNRYSAPPDGPAPAPHTTGGAVDLWLCDEAGNPLDLHSSYDPEDRASFPMNAPRLSPEVRCRRAWMRSALESAGLTNYPSEYWHWSYGDQGWAYRGGHSHALYGAVEINPTSLRET